jgi:cell wall-associated NlpC family hydrolase
LRSLRAPAALGLTIVWLAVVPVAGATSGGAAQTPSGGASSAPPAPAAAADPSWAPAGGAVPNQSPTQLHPTVSGSVAVLKNGIAYAPTSAPVAVQHAIWAANTLRGKPYIWGGGHQNFRARGYDCSGTVSFALHAGGLLATPLDSSDFMHWGKPGKGQWITIYTNPSHAFAIIAGLRLDTSGPGASGPRWRAQSRSTRGFRSRHPLLL